jgi:hypothetical protein
MAKKGINGSLQVDLFGEERLMYAEEVKVAWSKGLTKETNSSLAAVSKRTKGTNKENNVSIRAMVRKNTGKPNWKKGLTKETDKRVARFSNTVKGRTKENNEGVAKSALTKTGRNKENHEGMARMSEIMKLRVGEKNPNWSGGISFLPYSKEFNRLMKAYIRERDNHTCQRCGVSEDDYKKAFVRKCNLPIHHINYDKTDGNEDNLISLCVKCNGNANSNRDFWVIYFNAKICVKKIPKDIVIYG